MHPELFHLGGITIYSYGFCILLGVVAAWFFLNHYGRPYGLNSDRVSELMLWCIVGVFGGGKLFFFFENPGRYIAHPSEFFSDIGSGFVFYGSFLCTVPILIWWFRRRKLPVWDMFDLAGIAGALVHGFGKIGCFMAGCCHGKVCSSGGWAVTFTDPATRAEPRGLPLYPTQLWDAAIIFFTIAVMWYLLNRKQFAGQLFLLYGLVYAVGRFFTEKYRGDEERGFVLNGLLSHSQAIALAVFGVCALLYFLRWRKAGKESA
ncbi:MAG: prolipoprotein diacylglyceryl transferase [Bacteroidetes bacterium]|nr:prolipoprotein diacylglyceryl transferase [Bacteroidota bacterium]